MANTKDLVVYKGKTFSQVIRWEGPPYLYKTITSISNAAPVRITCPLHGLTLGWRCQVESVKGMTQMNDGVWHKAVIVDPNIIEFNDVNSLDFKAYVSGGVIKYNTPVNLSGFTARMSIKDKIGGTELAALTTVNNQITIDTVALTITITLSAIVTAAFTAKKGVYDLELVSSGGVVTGLLSGNITFISEVTT